MPRYRVDVFLHDDDYGVIAHLGHHNVEARNRYEAQQKGYDWFWEPRWTDPSWDVHVISQRIPKVKACLAASIVK